MTSFKYDVIPCNSKLPTRKRIKYKSGFKYQLSRDYEIVIPILGYSFQTKRFSLDENGKLYIKDGYAWDGPSGPTIDTKSFMRGSLVHDVLYQAMRMELLPIELRSDVDIILHDICIEDGMCKIRAWWVLRGVQKGAKHAAHPDHKRKEYTAP
jgi:hypothetical protein